MKTFFLSLVSLGLSLFFLACPDKSFASDYFIDKAVSYPEILIAGSTQKNNNTFQLFSHGKPGALLLEGSWYSGERLANKLKNYIAVNPRIDQLNIYGCDFAKGLTGQKAVKELELALNVGIAASDNITGLGGDWRLEVGTPRNVVVPVSYTASLQSCALYQVGGTNGSSEVMNNVTVTYYEGKLGTAKLDADETGSRLGNSQFTLIQTSDSKGFNGNLSDATISWKNYLVTRVKFSDAQKIPGTITINDIDGMKNNGANNDIDNREFATIFGIDADGKFVKPTLTAGANLQLQNITTPTDPPFPGNVTPTSWPTSLSSAIVKSTTTYTSDPSDSDAKYQLSAAFGNTKVEWVYFMWAQVEASTTIASTQHASIDIGCLKDFVECIAPDKPTTTNTAICKGESVNLSTLSGGCTGSALEWYSSDVSRNPIDKTVTPGATQDYYAQCTRNTGCASARTKVVVTVNDIPAAPTVTNKTVCEGTSVDLTAQASCATAGSTQKWYNSGGTALASTTQTISAATSFLVECTNTTTTCTSARATLTISVNAKPAVPTVTNKTVCEGTSVDLTAQASCATAGSTQKWYNAAGTALASTTQTISAATSFLVECTNATTTCTSARATLTISVNAKPAVPTVTNKTVCEGTSVDLTAQASCATAGSTQKWYDAAGTALASTTQTISAATSFLVECTNATTTCTSARATLTISVNAKPAVPTVTNKTVCEGTSVDLTAQASCATAGSTQKWYNSGGTALASTTQTISAATSFLVECTNTTTTCTSARATLTISVNAKPAVPTVTNKTVCEGTSVDLTAQASCATAGSTQKWYNAAGTALASTTQTISAATSFLVECTNATTTCTSARATLTISVNAKPAVPTVTNKTVCEGTSVDLTAQASCATAGSTQKWYNAAGTALASTTQTISAATSFLVECTNATTTCTSARATLTISVNAKPAVPTVTNKTVCEGTSVDLTAQASCATAGSTQKWYNAAGTALASTTQTISAATSFLVECTNTTTTCTSAKATVTVNVNAKPATPTITAKTICAGESVDLAAQGSCTGSTIKWYDAAGTALASTTVTPSTTTNYLAECTNASSCTSAKSTLTVTVNDCSCSIDIDGTVYLDKTGETDGVNGDRVNGPTLGVYVSLIKGSSIVDTKQTDPQGNYAFTGLAAGTYKLVLATSSAGSLTAQLPKDYKSVVEGGPLNAAQLASGDGRINSEMVINISCSGISFTTARVAATAQYHKLDFGIIKEGSLPVTLVSFKGTSDTEGNDLTWETTSETDFDRFVIEKSEDPKTKFYEIGTVPGGVNKYHFNDPNAARGLNYYRLRMVDMDGSFANSKVIAIEREGGKDEHVVFPNPALNRSFSLHKYFPIQGYRLLDLSGKRVPVNMTITNENYQFKVNGDVSSGLYILEYTTNQKTYNRKIVIE